MAIFVFSIEFAANKRKMCLIIFEGRNKWRCSLRKNKCECLFEVEALDGDSFQNAATCDEREELKELRFRLIENEPENERSWFWLCSNFEDEQKSEN